MNRIEVAINEGRCVLIFGARALQDAETLGELRRRPHVPATVLSGEAPSPALRLDANAIAAATGKEGGIVCLIEAEGTDSVGLGQLANLIQAAAHKPRLVVAARAFNPFALPAALRTLKFEHDKAKPRDFLFKLPVPSAPVAPAAQAAEPKKKGGAPRIAFVGREAELAWLAERPTGAMVVAGPRGIGKRWLVEKALTGCQNRIPDFVIARGSEADSLYARLAMLTKDAGDPRLAEAITRPDARPAPAALAALAVECLQNVDATFVIDRLDAALRRNGTFQREGRLESLLRALLLGSYKARIVFLTTTRPQFYREGEGVGLPVLELNGLLGRELHEIFDAYRVEDFARDNFGRVHERIHGHPLAARMFAVAVRDPESRDELMESSKFFRLDGPSDVDAIRKRIRKAVDGLTEEERKDLSLLAHFRLPFTAADCELTGVKRENRLVLLGKGLLDMVPDETRDRTFYVHPLVGGALDERETSQFDLFEALGNQFIEASRKEKGIKALALAQEGNRFLFEAHRIRERSRMPYPDHDPALESLRDLIRSPRPRHDLAEQRIVEMLKADPANTEVLVMKAELLADQNAKPEAVAAVYAEAAQRAPTPEVFHHEADFCAKRGGGRKAAIAALERGCVAFPDNARIKRRLAGLYAEASRYDDAARVLREAMMLEPMMPDSYGLLGEVLLQRGPESWTEAAEALAEARRLDPDNSLHMARLGALLVETAGDDETRLAEAQALLESAVQADKKSYVAHLFLGRLLIDRGGDLDRADWLVKGAHHINERAAAPAIERARIAARRGFWPEAEALLDRAQKVDPSNWHVSWARGELFEARGLIFNAEPEYRKALGLVPPSAAGKARVEIALARTMALIASGAATEMAKAADVAAEAPVVASGPKRDPGTTTRRRRGKGGRGAAEAGPTADAGADVGGDAASAGGADAPEAAAPELAAEGASDAAEAAPVSTEAAAPPEIAVDAASDPAVDASIADPA